MKEIRPPKMDDSGRTKYPVLFRVYVPSPFPSSSSSFSDHMNLSDTQVRRAPLPNGRPPLQPGLARIRRVWVGVYRRCGGWSWDGV